MDVITVVFRQVINANNEVRRGHKQQTGKEVVQKVTVEEKDETGDSVKPDIHTNSSLTPCYYELIA